MVAPTHQEFDISASRRIRQGASSAADQISGSSFVSYIDQTAGSTAGVVNHLRLSQAHLGLFIVGSLASGMVGVLIAGAPVVFLPMAALPGVLLIAKGRMRARQRNQELEAAMPEAFGALSAALGSGCSLSQAMRFVGGHASEPIRPEFTRVSLAIDCGIPATQALDALLIRLPVAGLNLVTLALKVSERTGAPMQDLLGRATQLVGARIELRRLLDVKTAQARMSARMVGLMPVAMAGALSLLSQDFRRGIACPVGALSMVFALSLNLVAWLIIKKIMQVRL
ncbi:type II secretion system F family protein [Collinsella sp. AGMB00827]|uniref:Type II secretion system F family protein n=2 Tax=Collinsella ureilytica TaxID=2869515 RepID=A0ABS7MIN6_9ACTN|nr:type II secretion system F family protein [Collinsella urealyticum]